MVSAEGATHGDPVRRMLTDGPKAMVDPSLRSVARSLDEPAVAALWARSCEDFSGGILQVPGPVRLEIDKVVAEAGTLAVFNALAVGYARVPEALEKIVFGYPEEGQADADLEARRFLA